MKMTFMILAEMSTLVKGFALLNGEKLLKMLFQKIQSLLTLKKVKMMIILELLRLGGKL